jgi:hypothetical protein
LIHDTGIDIALWRSTVRTAVAAAIYMYVRKKSREVLRARFVRHEEDERKKNQPFP